MANPQQLTPLQPLTDEPVIVFPTSTPPDILQLQADAIDVLERRISITTFPLAYQDRIRAYYRFTPVLHQTSKPQNAAPRTNDTLDAI